MIKTFFATLAAILVGLKLAGLGAIATWPWWLVLSPVWVPLAVLLLVLAAAAAGLAGRGGTRS